MKKSLAFLCTMLLIFGLAGTASAVIFFTDITGTGRADWEAVVSGPVIETSDFPGAEYSTLAAGTPVDIGFGSTVDFTADTGVRVVPSSWATWSGGYTGEVLWTQGLTSLTGDFLGTPIGSFGFEAEPNPYSVWTMTLALVTGDSYSQDVDGYYGAKFFGWISDVPIAQFTISTGTDFAVGRFVASVPEPATLLLLGSGLVGLAAFGRRKFRKK